MRKHEHNTNKRFTHVQSNYIQQYKLKAWFRHVSCHPACRRWISPIL